MENNFSNGWNRGRTTSEPTDKVHSSLSFRTRYEQQQEIDRRKFYQSSCDGPLITEYASMGITKIISGGQTGADRAALDVALLHGFPHGGWCPKGRKAEDGPIDAKFELKETSSANYLQRTEWNVRDTDGTIVFTVAKEVSDESRRTVEFT